MPDEKENKPSDEETLPERDGEDDDAGEKGLGSESGGVGGEESAPNNPDPSTKGATKGTEEAI
jgi:hypothetical protein